MGCGLYLLLLLLLGQGVKGGLANLLQVLDSGPVQARVDVIQQLPQLGGYLAVRRDLGHILEEDGVQNTQMSSKL